MSDLELYVIQANIAHFARLLDTETDEVLRSRISALLREAEQKLETALAARRSVTPPIAENAYL